MFWPTVSSDGVYVFDEVEGAPLDPVAFMAKYPTRKTRRLVPPQSRKPLGENAGRR
jgi:hypothetical protein